MHLSKHMHNDEYFHLACPTNCASCTLVDGSMVCDSLGCMARYRQNTAECGSKPHN